MPDTTRVGCVCVCVRKRFRRKRFRCGITLGSALERAPHWWRREVHTHARARSTSSMSLFRTKGGKTSAVRMPSEAEGFALAVASAMQWAHLRSSMNRMCRPPKWCSFRPRSCAWRRRSNSCRCSRGAWPSTQPRRQGARIRARSSTSATTNACSCAVLLWGQCAAGARGTVRRLHGARTAETVVMCCAAAVRAAGDHRGRWRPWGTMGDHGGPWETLETVGDAIDCSGRSTCSAL